ncbi:MAG TPA: cupin domain-containing protein, partial [Puia sp.]|nr:cupin domain-containing protein [Puia sp.]
MRPSASYWINKLQLEKHVEGGAFRETYRSPLTIPRRSLPLFFQGDRSVSTSIYFLLGKGQFSAFHRIASDELWHFYFGDPLLIYEIGHSGLLTTHLLGSDPEKGESFQVVIKTGSWFASIPAE